MLFPLVPANGPSLRIPDADMIHAFNHPIFVDDFDDEFTMFVGADPAANLLEIGVVDTTTGRSSCTPCPPDPRT